MTSAAVEPRSWSPLRRAVIATCLLAVQAGFSTGLPARPACLRVRVPWGWPSSCRTATRRTYPDPSIRSSWSARMRTVFPAGPGFKSRPSRNLQESNPPPFLLQPQTDRLGAIITQTLSNDLSPHFEVATMPGPRFDDMTYSPNPVAPVLESTLTIEGKLAGRPLLSRPVLKLQPADTILSNSDVLVVVDAGGRVFAPPVLAAMGPAGTTSSADPQALADADALALAADLLFQPLARVPGQSRPDSASLTPGRLVFHWQTIPKTAAATNDPAATRGP